MCLFNASIDDWGIAYVERHRVSIYDMPDP